MDLCPHCQSSNLHNKGKRGKKKRYQCRDCGKYFSLPNNKCIIEDTPLPDLKIDFLDKNVPEFNTQEWFDLIEHYQGLDKKAGGSQDSAKIRIEVDNHPIAVMYSADWHLGSLAVDYQSFRDHLSFLINNNRFMMALVGDLIENFVQFKTKAPIFAQIIPKERQEQLLKGVFNELTGKRKLLFAASGNHDIEFDERLMGYSPIKRLLQEQIPFFRGQGVAQIIIANEKGGKEVSFTNAVTHKSRFNSFLNQHHTNQRLYQLFFPGDVVVSAHLHTPAISNHIHYIDAERMGLGFGGRSWFIRTGTFKTDDTHSQRYFKQGRIGIPTVVYFPDKRQCKAYETPYEADAVMQAWENGYKEVAE